MILDLSNSLSLNLVAFGAVLFDVTRMHLLLIVKGNTCPCIYINLDTNL